MWDVNVREQKLVNIREVNLCTVALNLLIFLYKAESIMLYLQNLWAAFQKILNWILKLNSVGGINFW